MRNGLWTWCVWTVLAPLLAGGCFEDLDAGSSPEGLATREASLHGSEADGHRGPRTHTLYVDPGAELGGDGSLAHPYRRLTDALAEARRRRAEAGEQAWAHKPIVIGVGPGVIEGSYDPVALAEEPELEPLPFIVNVPRIVVRGSTELVLDTDGRPTGDVGEVVTRIVSRSPLGPADAQPIFVVTDTADGFAGNGGVVEGFSMASGHTATRGGVGVLVLRVDDYAIRGNLFSPRFQQAIDSRHASGAIEGNFATDTAICAICVSGPGQVNVRSNRALNSLGGLLLATTFADVPLDLGIYDDGADGLFVAPLVVPVHPRLTAVVADNDLSGHRRNANASFGVRIQQYGLGTASVVEDPRITLLAWNNRLHDNAFGVIAEAGFPERGGPDPTGRLDATLGGNDVADSVRTPLFVTFTRNTTTLTCQDVDLRPYLQDARYDLRFRDGDAARFDGMWIDHPAVDAFDGRQLHNRLRIDGEVVPAPFRDVPPAPDPC